MVIECITTALLAVSATLSDEIPVTSAGYADAPAIACAADGSLWLAWQENHPGDSSIWIGSTRDGQVTDQRQVHSVSGDLLSPGLCLDSGGVLWIVWAESLQGQWDVYARSLHEGQFSGAVQLTHDGSSFHPVVASGQDGAVWVAWQSKREGNFRVYARRCVDGVWSEATCVSENRSSNWQPALTVDQQGRAWVAWDTFRNGNYDIYLRHTTANSAWSEPIRLTMGMQHDMTVSLAPDREGGVWAAWVRAPRWGKEHYRLNVGKRLMLRQVTASGDQFLQPQADRRDLDSSIPIPVDSRERIVPLTPRTMMGSDGTVHVLYRQYRDQGNNDWGWHTTLVSYAGEQWSDPLTLSTEPGFPISQPATAFDTSGQLWVAYQSVGFAGGRKGLNDAASNIHLRCVSLESLDAPVLVGAVMPDAKHVETFEVARPDTGERPSLAHDSTRYQLLWGDLHRHSTLSKCVPERDGTLWDHYRWAHDVAHLDFYATTDHTEQTSQGEAQRAQVWSGLFEAAPGFVTLYGCEQNFRDTEHTNFLYVDRAIGAAVREARLTGALLGKAIQYLDDAGLQGKVLIARHFHGDGFGQTQGTAPPFHPAYERVMEVVQTRGFSPATLEHYLESGVEAGLIGGSDHARAPGGPGGPWVYPYALTGVWAETASRQGVFDGLMQRRCFATNGKKIQVEFTADGRFMGESYETDGAPTLILRATATTRIELLEIIRDGEVLLSRDSGQGSDTLEFQDPAVLPGKHYYYARVTQARETEDNYRGMAVTSPIWITVQ